MSTEEKKLEEAQVLPIAETFAQILAANKAREAEPIIVPCPEWGLSIVVRQLDVKTSIRIGESTSDEKGKTNIPDNLKKTFFAGVVKPIVSPDDLDSLLELNNTAFMRVIKAINGKKNELSKS